MTALIIPIDAPTRDAWLDTGRALAAERRDVDWRLADWLHDGKAAGYVDQTGFDFLAENLGIAPKRLRDITRAAEAFPPALRDAALSIEHHASVAHLPEPQLKLDVLARAKAGHWTPERTLHEARAARDSHEADRSAVRTDDALLESFIHHWNRLPKHLRLDAAEMIAASKGEEIEP